MKRILSDKYFAQAKKLFPGGVNSPVRAFNSVDGDPVFFESGNGPYFTDVDSNEYIDFCCSWGPLILGHNHPGILSKIQEAVVKGTTFGAPNKYSMDLAELIIDNNRFIEKIRFVSSGTEAVMSAVRLARGATGRNKIIKFEGCYHGHVDHLLVKAGSGLATFGTSSSAGVPEVFANETIVVPLNDKDALESSFKKHGDDIACIIVEPIPANNGLLVQDAVYLKFLREICTRHGALLIFDEVISGFRVNFEGASGFYDIQPDIITYGKIIGGGMPVGAYAASSEMMSNIAPEGAVYQAGTLSGNPVAMAAGYAQIKACLEPGFYCNLYNNTRNFVNELNQHAIEKDYPFKMNHIGSIFWLSFSKDRISRADQIDGDKMNYFRKLHPLLLDHGIYLGPSGYEVGFVSDAHSPEVLKTAAEKIKVCLAKVFS